MADNKLNEKVTNRGNLGYGIKPDMILYQVSVLGITGNETKIIERNDEEYSWIINNKKLASYELKYFKQYNGMTDVIVYSKAGETRDEFISCYTFETEEFARVCSKKNLVWEINYSMINFVIPMFAAFREHGITFINDSINEITDKYLKERNRQPKTLSRRKPNNEGNR